MRRIKDSRENETEKNVRDAFEKYATGKHKRAGVREYEADLDENVRLVLADIINETFVPQGYTEADIFDKKHRRLAKAPVRDHHTEAAAVLPYEQQIYDKISWRAPAVRPGMGTHGFFRDVRNDLYRCSQKELYYYITLDIHHYFPQMDHSVLKREVDNKFKKGKLRNLIYKVIDSYLQGAPLGIKIAQLFGMIDLADFDRRAERFFNIADDPERLSYWTSRYIAEKIMTASSPEDGKLLEQGSLFLAARFQRFAREGLRHYYRFVDNFLVMHEDKTFLRIVRELIIMFLTRDYLFQINPDHNVRSTWMGIRLCGYVFYHEHTDISKLNKQNLARKVHHLQKKGLDEEQIRIRLSSQFGFVKHADTTHLFKILGMEKTLGKIINRRRVRPPFKGMSPEQKVSFSSIVNKNEVGGGKIKILLTDYVVQDSRIEKNTVTVSIPDSEGNDQQITKTVPGKVIAIRFKKIVKTFEMNGEESYVFEKKKDQDGNPMEEDAEYYTFSGSRIMIDQALNDFTPDDLPCPTVIQQFQGKDGKTYTKFT